MQIAKLSEASGVPVQAIKRYITLGLVPPALGKNKGAYYTSVHLEALRWIKLKLADGMNIPEIVQLAEMAPKPVAKPAIASALPMEMRHYAVFRGLTLIADPSAFDAARCDAAVAAIHAALGEMA